MQKIARAAAAPIHHPLHLRLGESLLRTTTTAPIRPLTMAVSFKKDHATQDVASTSTVATASATPAAQNASPPRLPSAAGQSTVNASSAQADAATTPPKKKTLAEIDAELALKMAEMAGDGGMAGVELEVGQPTAMKRGVRNNMFRYI